ncbi:putative Rho-GTPase-activating protein 6 [Fusarium austroafricanum]|uniref:Putative Rho-GTPase-activating protein 6 n=1 Tax=Fusarium austroafricanum TaxID=2364996 RepID=A0A8H4NXK1_9HYPO|nr:putative Rho-GTPase-activating protein 6 [Fusarium austroafricanum]
MDQHYHPTPLGHYSAPETVPQHRLSLSRSNLSFQATIRHITDQGPVHTRKTWTTSSGDHNILSDTDELGDRAGFVQEYNRLAKKGNGLGSPRKQGWLYRILRSSSNHPTADAQPTGHQGPRHKRSVSDLAHNLIHHRRETPKILDLQSMVRICGKSMLYLPPEHAPSALILPTCLRATAHHIAQHVTTRGIFRIPGSIRVVDMLYNYYCCTDNIDITNTVRCANLPMHVQASVHDVASTFKRLLSVIPGGILGSLALFDALVAIHSQLQGDPEFPRTKQTKVRARLIALAIATVESQFRRELICAVFGLLSLIGRVAEITPREDEEGRSLPTGDLMGYNALGIVFGPLLLGDVLGFYSMKLATPKSGLLVLPLRSPKLRQDRHMRRTLDDLPAPPTMDKILIANTITEMLIVNWRNVVRQMKSLGMNRPHEPRSMSPQNDSNESGFVIKKPQGWDREWRGSEVDEIARQDSPEPHTPTLGISKQRSRSRGSSASKRLGMRPNIGFLSPTLEESVPQEDLHDSQSHMRFAGPGEGSSHVQAQQDYRLSDKPYDVAHLESTDASHIEHSPQNEATYIAPTPMPARRAVSATYQDRSSLSLDDVPPRTSSKREMKTTPLRQPDIGEPTSQDTARTSATKETTSIERKGAIRKKHPGKGKHLQTPRPSLAVEWSEPATRSSDISMGGPPQPTRLEFSSEKEALEAALKAHFDELRELDSLDQHKSSPPDANTDHKLQISTLNEPEISQQHVDQQNPDGEYAFSGSGKKSPSVQELMQANSASTTPRQFYAPMQRVSSGASGGLPRSEEGSNIGQSHEARKQIQEPDSETPERLQPSRVVSMPIETPKSEAQRQASTPWFSIPKRKPRALTRPSLSPTNNQGGVKAMAAKFESNQSAETSPMKPRSASKTQTLILQFSQESPEKNRRSTRSFSTSGHNKQNVSISGQNQQHSRNPSVGINTVGDEAHEQDLRVSIREEAAMKAVELQQGDKGRKPQSLYEQAQMLAQRQTIPPKPIQGERGKEASLENPRSLGTMMPYPEQPPIAQHLNLMRPSSSASNAQHRVDASTVPQDISTPVPRPGSTTTLHTQIRRLQRQLDLKTEETVHLKRQLEVQEDADVGTLSQQLREAKREAQMWRERAESAERRIKVFERFTARLKGIREAAAVAGDETLDTDNIIMAECFDEAGADGQKENTLIEGALGYESDSSGRTEDAGVVKARIRRCLHGLTDGPTEEPMFRINQTQDTGLGERPKRDISPSTVEVWMAAQELLHHDEAQGQAKERGASKSSNIIG